MFVLVPAGDLSSQSSDTLMSLRTNRFLRWFLWVRQGCVIPPVLVKVRWGLGVRPVLGELGWGRAVAFLVCCLVAASTPANNEPSRIRV